MSLCYTVITYKWVTVIDDIKFEFNDITFIIYENDSERRQFVSLEYFIFYLCYYYTYY